MGWDKGRYYTRSKKVNGRIVREYVGTGRVGELAAQLDAVGREHRALVAAERRMERTRNDDLVAQIQALIDVTDLLACAALAVAGFRQHNRGEWRKTRVRRQIEDSAGPKNRGRDSSPPAARSKG